MAPARFKLHDKVRLVRVSPHHNAAQGVDQWLSCKMEGRITSRADNSTGTCYGEFRINDAFNRIYGRVFGSPVISWCLYEDMLDPMWEDFPGGVRYRVYLGQHCWQRSFDPALTKEECAALALEKTLDDLNGKVGAKNSQFAGVIKSTGEEFALLEIGR